jgi:nucleoid-associated protein YgaU
MRSMGREPFILLAGLGLLAGGFVGVLSMKLLSPRPPLGAGVDIHDAAAIATPAEIVEPPALTRPVEQPTSMRAPASEASVALPVKEPADRYAAIGSSFSDAQPVTAEEPAAVAPVEASPAASAPPRDPFAGGSRFDDAAAMIDERSMDEPQRLDPIAVDEARPLEPDAVPGLLAQPDPLPPAAAVAADLSAPRDTRAAAAAYMPAASGQAPRHEVTRYVAAAGDSWWSLAERMYGDGRYYRALFAWNRAVNPRVSLVPGTPLELPPLSKLAVAWPALVPDEEPRREADAGG